jgi:hypothetical protein
MMRVSGWQVGSSGIAVGGTGSLKCGFAVVRAADVVEEDDLNFFEGGFDCRLLLRLWRGAMPLRGRRAR